MNFTKEIQVTKTVIDETKIKVGDKVLLKSRSFYDDKNKDSWEYETECVIDSIYEDFIVLKDLDYSGYEYTIKAENIANEMYVGIEIIE